MAAAPDDLKRRIELLEAQVDTLLEVVTAIVGTPSYPQARATVGLDPVVPWPYRPPVLKDKMST